MLQKFLFMGPLLDDPSVVNIPKPKPGGIGGRPEGFPSKMFYIQIGNYGAYWWTPSHSLNLF